MHSLIPQAIEGEELRGRPNATFLAAVGWKACGSSKLCRNPPCHCRQRQCWRWGLSARAGLSAAMRILRTLRAMASFSKLAGTSMRTTPALRKASRLTASRIIAITLVVAQAVVLHRKNGEAAPVHDDKVGALAIYGAVGEVGVIKAKWLALRAEDFPEAGLGHHAVPGPHFPDNGFEQEQHLELCLIE